MKKLLTTFVIMMLVTIGLNTGIVEAVGVGGSIDVDGVVAETEPLIWLCDSRLMFDDNIQPGRMTEGGNILFERMNNYAFEGEQIEWSLLVYDKNGIGEIEHVYVTVGEHQGEDNDIEVNCNQLSEVPGYCFGTPEQGTCENYDYDQCMEIEGCDLTCDLYVDYDTNRNCDGNTVCYTTIQSAVDAASDNEIICVYDGTYAPFTVNEKNDLTIKALSNPVVTGVQSVSTNYTNRDCVVFVEGSTNIVLEGLDIQGQNLGSINTKSYGIIYEGSSGEIKDCTVSPNTVDDMSSSGIGIWDSSNVNVDTNTVENFGRIGIFVYNGCDVEIYCNTVECQVYPDEGKVCYGIEVEGAFGDDDPSTASQVEIKRNEIFNCDNTFSPAPTWESSGIYINGWLEFMAEADSTVVIENNNIHDNYKGIIAIKSSSSYAHFNNIYNNRVYGVESLPAYDTTTSVFDAENNWWGDTSGPTHTGNPGGTGDAVSDDVDYDPWGTSEVSIPECEYQEPPICEGTPSSCELITTEYKCNQETEGCDWYLLSECNARIGQEELEVFDSDIMQYYTCLFTVETPESYHMDDEYFVTAEVCDLTDNCNTMDEHEFWYFNPVVALTIDLATVYEGEESSSIILFNKGDPIAPGTTAYSNTLLVGNGADPDSGVRLDMFITGTDFYDSSSSGAKCPTTNQLALGDGDSYCDVGPEFGGTDSYTDPFCYFATHGAYSTGDFIMSDGRADTEGYVGIMHGDGNVFNPTALYDNAEIIQAGPMNYDYYQANIISPGAEMAITFRLNLPAPCVGDFDTGNIYFWGEAV